MEAHHVLSKKGFNVDSYGTNSTVKLPGPSIDKPNSYSFGTSYEHIYQDLLKKDSTLYTQNGLLMLLDRNRKIKTAPQRFQETSELYDVLITCEERCYDIVCEDLMERGYQKCRPVHVVNFDIKDTPDDATVGARAILQLAQQLEECSAKNLDNQIEVILDEFQKKSSHPILYSVHYY